MFYNRMHVYSFLFLKVTLYCCPAELYIYVKAKKNRNKDKPHIKDNKGPLSKTFSCEI